MTKDARCHRVQVGNDTLYLEEHPVCADVERIDLCWIIYI